MSHKLISLILPYFIILSVFTLPALSHLMESALLPETGKIISSILENRIISAKIVETIITWYSARLYFHLCSDILSVCHIYTFLQGYFGDQQKHWVNLPCWANLQEPDSSEC